MLFWTVNNCLYMVFFPYCQGTSGTPETGCDFDTGKQVKKTKKVIRDGNSQGIY